MRSKALSILTDLIKETYPGKRYNLIRINIGLDIRVEIYGSMATGLAIDSSDMDILVSGVFKDETPDRDSLIRQMNKLHKQITNLKSLEKNSIIETATVPVIKIVSVKIVNDRYLDSWSWENKDWSELKS